MSDQISALKALYGIGAGRAKPNGAAPAAAAAPNSDIAALKALYGVGQAAQQPAPVINQGGEQPSMLESGLRGAAQGVAFDFADEITAGAEALFTDKTYDEALGESRANYKAAREANPWTYGLSSAGAGVASSLVPGLGLASSVRAAPTLKNAITAGMAAGAISGAGASEASLRDNPGQLVEDAAVSSAWGGAIGGGAHALGGAAKRVFNYADDQLGQAFSPTQRHMALGAKTRNLDVSSVSEPKFNAAVEYWTAPGSVLDKARTALKGRALDNETLVKVAEGELADAGQALNNFADVAAKARFTVDDDALLSLHGKLQSRIAEYAKNKLPEADIEGFNTAFKPELDAILGSNGTVGRLLQLRSKAGGLGKFTQERPSAVSEAYQIINRELDELVDTQIAPAMKQLGAGDFEEINRRYAAAANLLPSISKQRAAELTQSGSLFGMDKQDTSAAAGVGALAMTMGAGPLAVPAGWAAAAANKWSRGVGGRLARANLGDKARALKATLTGSQVRKVADQAAQQQAAMGFIPRARKGAQEWLKTHLPTLPPELQQMAKAIVSTNPTTAEAMLRGAMPAFAQYFTPSKYPSELDGKVSSMDDKLAIERRLKELKFPARDLALRQATFNRTARIPDELYEPSEYAEELAQFQERMGGM